MAQGIQVIPDGLSPDGDPVLDDDLRFRLGQRIPFQSVALRHEGGLVGKDLLEDVHIDDLPGRSRHGRVRDDATRETV